MVVHNNIKHILAAIIAGCLLTAQLPAGAAEIDGGVGFYGGVSLRNGGNQAVGLQSANAPAASARIAAGNVEDPGTRALVYGGYRWKNDVAVEASLSTIDKYALRPGDALAIRGTGGSQPGGAPAELQARSWNLDLTTSWAFYKSFSLYGRLGYAQAEHPPIPSATGLVGSGDPMRLRDGVNYGLGLRYDVGSDLGLHLDYGRHGRAGGDAGTLLPDTNEVRFGVQFRF